LHIHAAKVDAFTPPVLIAKTGST